MFDRYTALGDGEAAGVGLDYPPIPGDYEVEKCGRSAYSYPWQFATEFGPSIELDYFNFPACDEANSTYSLSDQIESGSSLQSLPTVLWDFAQPDLVSISASALSHYDVFRAMVEACVEPQINRYWDDAMKAGCNAAFEAASSEIFHAHQTWEPMLRHALMFNRGPNSQVREVYVLGQPQIYSLTEDHCPGKGMPTPNRAVKRDFNQLIREFNKELKTAADKAGVVYVDVDDKFKFHRICDKDSWISTSVGKGALYPTYFGHNAIKDAFAEKALQLKIEYT